MAAMRVLINHRAAAAGVACLVVVAVAVWLLLAGGSDRRPRSPATTAPAARAAGTRERGRAPPHPAVSHPDAPHTLAAAINAAQRVIDAPGTSTLQLQAAGRREQLAVLRLEHMGGRARRGTLRLLSRPAARGVRAALQADSDLSGLAIAERRLPPWRIISPPPVRVLMGYFRAGQAQYGIPWEDLAAIEFIETHFGRIRGASPVGAQGPMQFMPATWAQFGHGSINDPRAAILAAARYLHSNGAPRDMPDALYHYNNSIDYVRAVGAYAAAMRADPRLLDGYYQWQVIYTYAGRTVVLPVGFPRSRPVTLAAAHRRR
ncbi:MAG TPA: lytic transglycosylase domain-containing protein [Solirubrobacteraceae bacterium]|nr:lytic transglycosylase domain-containing protein [Solirubrobacteraceae bacterium]